MKLMTKPARSAALALAIASVLGSAAHAQQTTTLEEIVVTAERRPQNLQDIPTAATVLTADSLAKQGVKNILDIQQVAPSVAINTYNRGTFINIRGVGIAQSVPTSVPGVATYIDGVYIPHETFIAQSFYDMSSVEVLRGPQGTLTGQNSTGGAIYMRTPEPQFGEFSGYVDQTAANYSWYRTVGAVNVPMGDKAAMRVAAVYDKTDSYTTNIGPSPSQPGSHDLKSVRAAVRLQPLDVLSFDLRYEHFNLKSGYNAIKNRNDVVSSDPFTIEEDALSYLNQDGYRASIEARLDITSAIQLRALTSRLNADNEDLADGDRTATALPVPAGLPASPANTKKFPGRVGLTQQSFDTKVTEVNLLSTDKRMVQWVVGGFYMTETTPVKVLRDNYHTTDFVASNSDIVASAHNKSSSGFGQLDIRFTDAFAFDLGARYSKDEQDYTRYVVPGPPPPGGFPYLSSAESSQTTGRVGVKYFAAEDVMFYSTLSKGYKAGGVNLTPGGPNFAPETNKVAEVGFKSTVADGHLRVNGDVFYSNYDGIQLSALTPVGSGPLLPNTLNGKAKSYGAELEMLGQLDQFGFNLGLAYLHAAFDGAQNFTNSETGLNQDVPDGQTLPFSPEVTFNGGIQYQFHLGGKTLTPRLQASYLAEQLATPFPTVNTIVPSHLVTDLRATFDATDNLKLEGFISNLLDKTYIAVQVQDASSAAGGKLYGAPRQFGVRATYKF